jgi:uncharacterized protein (TIGR02588 family)
MSTREANSTGRETRPARDQGRSAAEWVTLSVSIAIIAVLVGLVITVYLFGGDEPATIEVRPLLEEVRHADGTAYLPVEVTNNGDRTAEDVYVQMTLHTDEVEPVTTSFTIRFLAGGEQQRGVVAFNQNPAEGELRWTLSFIEP